MSKEPMFSRREIPSEAGPVKLAQSMFLLAVLLLLALSFFIDGIFSWVFPVSIPFAAYYALTVHRTGYALGQNAVYTRTGNPVVHGVHVWGSIGYVFLAFAVWLR